MVQELEKENRRNATVENYVALIEKGVDIDPVFNQVSAQCLNNAANVKLPGYFTDAFGRLLRAELNMIALDTIDQTSFKVASEYLSDPHNQPKYNTLAMVNAVETLEAEPVEIQNAVDRKIAGMREEKNDFFNCVWDNASKEFAV